MREYYLRALISLTNLKRWGAGIFTPYGGEVRRLLGRPLRASSLGGRAGDFERSWPSPGGLCFGLSVVYSARMTKAQTKPSKPDPRDVRAMDRFVHAVAELKVAAHRRPRDPRVIAAIEDLRRNALAEQIMPRAVQAHIELLDPRTPPATRAKAVQMAYDEWSRLNGSSDGQAGKDPSEMTFEELTRRREALEAVLAARAIDVTSSDPFS